MDLGFLHKFPTLVSSLAILFYISQILNKIFEVQQLLENLHSSRKGHVHIVSKTSCTTTLEASVSDFPSGILFLAQI